LLETYPTSSRAPLTFSQLAHWNTYELHRRKSIRQVASVTRLLGPLSVEFLRQSLAEVVRRHTALRTRIVLAETVPVQEISGSADCELELVDLAAGSKDSRDREIARLMNQLVLDPIDVAKDPLVGMRLLRIRDGEHILMVAMEHMISDAASLNIVLNDLSSAYSQISRGDVVTWADKPRSFADYALWQRSAFPSWLETHGAYWNELSVRGRRMRFPVDVYSPSSPCSGWGSVEIHIDTQIRAALSAWCRPRRTTLVMSVFTAYAASVLRWCDASEVVIQYLVDGRMDRYEQIAIGFFAAALYLKLQLADGDRLVDLLHQAMRAYGNANERADFSYIEAQQPRPEITRNTSFNWIPRRPGVVPSASSTSANALSSCPVAFDHPMLHSLDKDNEPMIVLHDTEEEVVGHLYFPRSHFSAATMMRFANNFKMLLGTLLERPERRVRDIPLLGVGELT
jgi:hypothetical protein